MYYNSACPEMKIYCNKGFHFSKHKLRPIGGKINTVK